MFGAMTRGVAISERQGAETAPPMTLLNVADVRFMVVEYGDETSTKCREVVLVVDEKDGPAMYQTPGGMQWTTALKPFNAKLNKQLKDRLVARASGDASKSVPKKDAVDVV